MAEPKMCKVTDEDDEFNLDDIGVHSDGITKLSVFGRKPIDILDFMLFILKAPETEFYMFCKQIQ